MLPSKRLLDVSTDNLAQLRLINQVVFPIVYNDRYYEDVLRFSEFAKLAFYNDICVGAVACKKEPKGNGRFKLYVMTLGVLAPYRRLHFGTDLLLHVLKQSERDGTVDEIYLHTNNEDAMEFYKKFNFQIIGKREKYYRNIEQQDAWILEYQINTASLLPKQVMTASIESVS